MPKRKNYIIKYFAFIVILGLSSTLFCPRLYAPWVWSPDGGWMNQKDMVKESPKAQWDLAQDLEKEKKYNNAARAYKALIKAYPTSPLAPKAYLRMAENYKHDGEWYEAFQAYQKLLEIYPKEIDFEYVLGQQYQIGEMFVKGKKRKLLHLPVIPARDKGIEILETLVKNAPYSEIAPEAQFQIGTAYKKMGKYDKAIEAYQNIILNYKDTPWYEEALYQMGWCYYRKSRGFSYDQLAAKESTTLFQRFVEEFPHSKHTPKINKQLAELTGRQAKGVYQIARFYEAHGHKEAAIMYYKQVIEKNPGTKEAQDAARRLKKLQK